MPWTNETKKLRAMADAPFTMHPPCLCRSCNRNVGPLHHRPEVEAPLLHWNKCKCQRWLCISGSCLELSPSTLPQSVFQATKAKPYNPRLVRRIISFWRSCPLSEDPRTLWPSCPLSTHNNSHSLGPTEDQTWQAPSCPAATFRMRASLLWALVWPPGPSCVSPLPLQACLLPSLQNKEPVPEGQRFSTFWNPFGIWNHFQNNVLKYMKLYTEDYKLVYWNRVIQYFKNCEFLMCVPPY